MGEEVGRLLRQQFAGRKDVLRVEHAVQVEPVEAVLASSLPETAEPEKNAPDLPQEIPVEAPAEELPEQPPADATTEEAPAYIFPLEDADAAVTDPYGWREGETYYAIFGGSRPAVAKSKRLAGEWTYVGDLMANSVAGVAANEDVSCADFFRLGDRQMLLDLGPAR